MSQRICVAFALVGILVAVAGSAQAQEPPAGSGAVIAKALQQYVQARGVEERGEEPQLKAVPRTDKAEAAVIGGVAFVDATDFLDDGTPFRIIAVTANRPFSQEVLVVCLGSSFNASCGRLALGKRVSITSDILVIDSGDNAGLALFIVKKLQT
jgi:hypothetical protein